MSAEMSLQFVVFAVLFTAVLAEKAHIDFRFPVSTRKLEGRVVGGDDAYQGQFPHQVSLQRAKPGAERTEHFCGGSILNSEWILTAGHCAMAIPTRGTFVVKAGKYNIAREEDTEQIARVRRIIMHKNYTGGVAPFDLALLKLKEPLKMTDAVQAIKLPEFGKEPTGLVTLSGWGSTSATNVIHIPDILQTITLPIVDRLSCANAFRKVISGIVPLHETNICTGPLNIIGQAACKADSGGPLTQFNEDGVPEIVGVVSWAVFPCGSYNTPSVYVKVSNFVDWIRKTMANN